MCTDGTALKSDLTTDNDDDGETAAGGRLAHLLQILVSLIQGCTAWYANVLFYP